MYEKFCFLNHYIECNLVENQEVKKELEKVYGY